MHILCWGGRRAIWSGFKLASGDSQRIIARDSPHWIACPIIWLCVVTVLQTSLNPDMSKSHALSSLFFLSSVSLNAMHQGQNWTLARLRGQYSNHASWLCCLILIRISDRAASLTAHLRTLQQSQCHFLCLSTNSFNWLMFLPWTILLLLLLLKKLLKINSTCLNADWN